MLGKDKVLCFKQHVLGSSYQTKIWLNAHIPKPAVGSPLEHGWKDGKFGLEPILFEGQMSSDFPVCYRIVTEV
jgi:hypothetical protein